MKFEKEITRCTALQLACQEGFDKICGVLLAHGADANTVQLSDGALFEQFVGKRVVCGLRRWRSRVRCDAIRPQCDSRLGDVGRHDRAFTCVANGCIALLVLAAVGGHLDCVQRLLVRGASTKAVQTSKDLPGKDRDDGIDEDDDDEDEEDAVPVGAMPLSLAVARGQ